MLERQFRRVPRIIDIVSGGGTVKRYEIQPDPERLMRYGITLDQLQNAITNSNANVGGDYLIEGENVLNVRGIGLIGGGLDPTRSPEVLRSQEPAMAAAIYLRVRRGPAHCSGSARSSSPSINNVPIRVEDVVEGGPLRYADDIGVTGRRGQQPAAAGQGQPEPAQARRRRDDVVLDDDGNRGLGRRRRTKCRGSCCCARAKTRCRHCSDLEEKIKELNDDSGRLLPGVKIEPYYDRTDLIDVTTETVSENLVVGMVLVTLILLMFLSNVRSALIVAINIPLALLFAFAMLFLRGKSANLLSIGAVDFGIIVDSSVIMVENIYRHISSGEYGELPLKERILRACREVETEPVLHDGDHGLRVLAAVHHAGARRADLRPDGRHVCLRPGRRADAGADRRAGACACCAFKNLKPAPDNFLVRWLKAGYLRQSATAACDIAGRRWP